MTARSPRAGEDHPWLQESGRENVDLPWFFCLESSVQGGILVVLIRSQPGPIIQMLTLQETPWHHDPRLDPHTPPWLALFHASFTLLLYSLATMMGSRKGERLMCVADVPDWTGGIWELVDLCSFEGRF